jgi:uncharacterized protein (TIGR00255 family)
MIVYFLFLIQNDFSYKNDTFAFLKLIIIPDYTMMYSMTGFGKATAELPDKKLNVEIRSLNSKQLDLNTRIPLIYRDKESDLRNYISQKLERGKIDFTVSVEYLNSNKKYALDRNLALAYFQDLKLLSKEIQLKNEPDYLSIIARLPDIIKNEVEELNENEWNQLFNTVDSAINALQLFRKKEGENLLNEFKGRTQTIAQAMEKIKVLEPARKEQMKHKLLTGLLDAVGPQKMDQNRLEQELIYYIERLDITEEMVRLKSHIQYFLQMLSTTETSKGKKAGFILQEMGREINTIGSKANDADIQKIVIEMKDELEKLKEQSMNIL